MLAPPCLGLGGVSVLLAPGVMLKASVRMKSGVVPSLCSQPDTDTTTGRAALTLSLCAVQCSHRQWA